MKTMRGTGVKARRYRLLHGGTVDLLQLPKEDLVFLLDLFQRAMADEDYYDISLRVYGVYAYPLKGSKRVTTAAHQIPVFRVADDLATRVSIQQGAMGSDGDMVPRAEELISVTEAASRLGVTRSAIIRAAQRGRIQGRKVGRTWVLLEPSVKKYEVASHRVAAGRAGQRARRA